MSCRQKAGARKDNFRVDYQSKQVAIFFSSKNFLKEIENMFSDRVSFEFENNSTTAVL